MQIRLIQDWRKSYKFWSVRVGAAASGAIAYVFANPASITDALNSLPPEARAWLSPAVGAVIFGVVWGMRVLDQAKKDENNERTVAAVTVTEPATAPVPAGSGGNASGGAD